MLFIWQSRVRRKLQICEYEGVSKPEAAALARQAKSLRERSFIVQCGHYRCMAYRDGGGKWIDYFHGDELKGEVKIVSEA